MKGGAKFIEDDRLERNHTSFIGGGGRRNGGDGRRKVWRRREEEWRGGKTKSMEGGGLDQLGGEGARLGRGMVDKL